MRLLREATTSFAGGANDAVAPDEYVANQAQLMINMRPSLLGNSATWMDWARPLSKGFNYYAAGGYYESACLGAVEYYTALGVQQIVAIFNDAAYYSLDGGLTFTQISGATGLDYGYWSFATVYEGGSPVLCCANGGTSSYQWDGTTWSAISNIPSGTQFLAVHANRLISSGDSGAQVSGSKVGDIDTWAAPDGWVVNANDGSDDDEVTGLYSLGGVILVFKRRSFGYIEGFGYQTLQVAAGARGISRSVGCVAFRTIAPCGENAIMFLSELGFVYYALGGQPVVVSGASERFVAKINYDLIRRYRGAPTATWVPGRREYWCAVPLGVGQGHIAAGGADASARNSWTYIFRPGTQSRPPAAFFRYPAVAGDSTFTVGTDGMLSVSSSDLTNYMGFVNERGMLDVCKLPDPGLWAELDGRNMLDLRAPLDGPSALFTADTGAGPARPFSGTYENGVNLLERALGEEVDLVRNGDFAVSTEWSTSNVTIGSGVAQFDGVAGTQQIFQRIPARNGRTYRVRVTVSGRTTGTLVITVGSTTTNVTSNGVVEWEVAPSNLISAVQPFVKFSSTDSFDGAIDDVSVVDITGDETAQLGIIRTRPFSYGDEFTRKKAKRIEVAASQPLAHTMTVYALIDRVYQASQSLSFTAADAGQERRARVGGRGRVIQAELHVAADCVLDGIAVSAKPLRDER